MVGRVRAIIQQYASSTVGVRLLMRGVDARVLQPIAIQEQNTAAASNTATSPIRMISLLAIDEETISPIG